MKISLTLGTILGLTKEWAKSVVLESIEKVRKDIDKAQANDDTGTKPGVAELRQKVIDKFDHNRHIPGSIRKVAKKAILKLSHTEADTYLDFLEDKIASL